MEKKKKKKKTKKNKKKQKKFIYILRARREKVLGLWGRGVLKKKKTIKQNQIYNNIITCENTTRQFI